MRRSGRSGRILVVALTAGTLLAAGGCAKLQSFQDKAETQTLGDVAARVATLEQQVADLQLVFNNQTPIEPVDGMATATPRPKSTAERQATHQLAMGARAMVTASILNVRGQANTAAEKVATLKQGAIVDVIAVEGDWAKVQFTDNQTRISGWVAAEFLTQEE